DAIHRLEDVRDAITPERANAEFDEITLQLFWKKWPHLSAWAGSLWRMLSEECAGPATPHLDAELDEGGGSEGGRESPAVTALRDIMSTRVALTTPDTTVAEAAAGMVKAKVGSAIVMQGRFLAGILTERDVMRSAASGEDLRVARVADWMTPDPQAA